MSSKILMLRHGITEGNKNRWFYGALDLPLLPEGREELLRHKEENIYPNIPENAYFYTTGLMRTEETLEIIFGKRDHETLPDLREMEFGICEAKTFEELENDPHFVAWLNDEEGDYRFPEGESRNDFAERVRRGYNHALDTHNERASKLDEGEDILTVIICHGGVIAGLMHELFMYEKNEMWDWMPSPGFGYLIELKDGVPFTHQYVGR